MKSLSPLLTAAALLLGFAPSAAYAAASVEVFSFLAPSTASPSYFGNSVNTQFALRSFPMQSGMPGTPAFAAPVGSIDVKSLVSTSGFNAWNGAAGPTGDFAGEFGNSVRFGVRVLGQGGQQVSLSQLGFSTLSNDLNYPFSSTILGASLNYGFNSALGVLAGPDGDLFTFDDVLVAAGPSTTLVDMFLFVSPGLSLSASCSGCTLSQQQAAIDGAANLFTGTSIGAFATMGVNSGQAQMNITRMTGAIPEPATWAMLITGFGLVGATLRKRRAAMA
jgi:hypothetical protein